MKRLFIVVLLVLVATTGYRFYGSPTTGTGSLTLPQPAPTPGEDAPPFEVAREDGGPFKVSGEGVYAIMFLSSLNRDTEYALPEFDRIARDYEGEGVSFAAVYVSYAPNLEEIAPYTVLQDSSGELTARYNIKTVPRLFLINDGKIEFVQNGYHSQNEELLREGLDRVLQYRASYEG